MVLTRESTATGRRCTNRWCSRPFGRKKGWFGFCVNCHDHWRRRGCQPCYFCAQPVLANAAPPGVVRSRPGTYVCLDCTDCARRRAEAWSFFFDACTACGGTDSEHAANGLCFACYQAQRLYGGPRQCQCGAETLRNFAREPEVRCQGCFEQRTAAIGRALMAGVPRATVCQTHASNSLVRRIDKYLKDGRTSRLAVRCSSLVQAEIERIVIVPDPVMVTADSLETLLIRSRAGDVVATALLIERFDRYLRKCFRSWYHPWGSFEDLIQEGMVGVWKAMRQWRPDGGRSFKTLALLYARRAISTALTTANRKKQRCVTNSDRLEAPVSSEDDRTLAERYGHWETPEAFVVSSDCRVAVNPDDYARPDSITHALLRDMLSFSDGTSYAERAERISLALNREVDAKAVDNARTRLARLDGLKAVLMNGQAN